VQVINADIELKRFRKESEMSLRKELDELQEFTRYEKDLRDASILQHQEVRRHLSLLLTSTTVTIRFCLAVILGLTALEENFWGGFLRSRCFSFHLGSSAKASKKLLTVKTATAYCSVA